jgi:hypothetical protein
MSASSKTAKCPAAAGASTAMAAGTISSKVSIIATSLSKYPWALIFQNFCLTAAATKASGMPASSTDTAGNKQYK